MRDRLTIVLPAYNEAGAIAGVIGRIRAMGEWPVLVVDDGSTDGTARAAEKAGARVLRHPYRKGNGAAVKSGIRAAQTDYVLLMDADGQHPPEKIPELIAQAGDHQLVIAARDGDSHASVARRVANALYSFLASWVTGRKIPDLTSGFRLFHRPTVLRFLYLFPNTFSYPATSTLAMMRAGHSVSFVPTSFDRRVGISKIRPIADGGRFLLVIFRIATMFAPLRMFVPPAIALFGIGLGYALYFVVGYRSFPPAALFLLVAGVLVFVLGLISEQIAQLRMAFTEQIDE